MDVSYRLVVLGDPHIRRDEGSLWREEIIPDINALRPDRVMVLGDLSGGPECGSAEATAESVEILSGLDAPWQSIIGNHDLQHTAFETDEAAVAMMLKALGREHPGFVVEEEALAIIGLDNTFWRRNNVNKNEIIFDQPQREWLESELRRLGEKPVILLGHTPPIGSGVMIMTELHARAGNAYANQNAVAGNMQEILWHCPNALFWFSGHNHLGQHYRDALSRRLGVWYAHTGTASCQSARDGCRHSRVLEIGVSGVSGFRLRTFDHTLRAIDPELDYADARSLAELMAERRRVVGKLYVARDPRTMEQPAPAACFRGTRFLFLSDAHSTSPLTPIQKRVAGWCARSIRALMPDAIVLGGDITHQAQKSQAEAFLAHCVTAGTPTFYLPGNNEGPAFDYPEGVAPVTACQRGGIGERAWFLPTGNAEQAAAAVDALLADLPGEGSCLVFAHFPPEMAGDERVKALENAPVTIYWFSGHRHRSDSTTRGSLNVTLCGGLDPIKVRGSLPELLVIDWDGESPVVRRLPVPKKFLNPPAARKPRHWAGLAFRGSGETLLRLAIERAIPAIQFHYRYSCQPPTATESALAREYRRQIPGGFLSLHLPNFSHPAEGLELADQEPALQFAGGIGVDDLTIHLPDVEAGMLFEAEGILRQTPWVSGCLEIYTGLAARALQMGAQISFENVYNKRTGSPGEERLGSRPWHLLRFVEEIRERLHENGFSREAVEEVGIIFDAGHAFADVWIAKEHGIADWLSRISPYLQLCHLHQVRGRPDGGGLVNHQAISEPFGPRINYYGLLSALRDVSRRPFPLFVEVRQQEAALESYATLLRTGLLREGWGEA